jgi:hypothetical protein
MGDTSIGLNLTIKYSKTLTLWELAALGVEIVGDGGSIKKGEFNLYSFVPYSYTNNQNSSEPIAAVLPPLYHHQYYIGQLPELLPLAPHPPCNLQSLLLHLL